MAEEVCVDYLAACRRAIGSLSRSGLLAVSGHKFLIERSELVSEGCLALSALRPNTEALAVTVARRAMIDALRKQGRRERGRVQVRSSSSPWQK